jgi:hypothetical protein
MGGADWWDVVAVIASILAIAISAYFAKRANGLSEKALAIARESNSIAEQSNEMSQTANAYSREANVIAQRALDAETIPRIQVEDSRWAEAVSGSSNKLINPRMELTVKNLGKDPVVIETLWIDLTRSRTNLDYVSEPVNWGTNQFDMPRTLGARERFSVPIHIKNLVNEIRRSMLYTELTIEEEFFFVAEDSVGQQYHSHPRSVGEFMEWADQFDEFKASEEASDEW